MKNVTVAAIILLAASPAIAQPAPAGKCSLVDNGVAQDGPTMREQGLQALSMPLPKGIGDAVADVSFRIQSDGAVSDVKVLCVTASDREARAIVETVNGWKFEPVKRDGKPGPANATFRVSAGGAIPLSFVPNPGPKKIEG